MQPPRVAGVLLAAGEGSRLGQPKALVVIGGQRLADRGVLMLRAGGADPIVVVTGAVPVEIPRALVVHNPAWSTGMGSSLTAGLSVLGALPPGECSAAVIALADQPLVTAECVRRLIASHAGDVDAGDGAGTGASAGAGRSAGTGGGASIAVASYGGRPRNPVLIARAYWAEVLTLAHGDAGARPFLRAHPDRVTLVECGDAGRPDDIDTPEDLVRVTEIVAGQDRALTTRRILGLDVDQADSRPYLSISLDLVRPRGTQGGTALAGYHSSPCTRHCGRPAESYRGRTEKCG